ncbi:MAG: hypothetical protein PHG95_03635 [Patescibacteria group bacterium]|nr:hypothetical protein [Patescibacteria group bacterium]
MFIIKPQKIVKMYKIEEKTGKIQQSRIASINDLLSECQVQGAKIASLPKEQQLAGMELLEKNSPS